MTETWRDNPAPKRQLAVVVRIDTVNGDLDTKLLNETLNQGWTVVSMAESTPGSVLVIVEKQE